MKTSGGVGVDGDQAKQPPFFFLSNLYPPLTPVPPCVAEIRAIGQSPIHCHPEYFKVKLHRLTKKVLLIKGLLSPPFLTFALTPKNRPPFFMHPSLYGPLFCLHTLERGRGGEAESFGSSPVSIFRFNEV